MNLNSLEEDQSVGKDIISFLSCPLTASEVYKFGINIEETLITTYLSLMEDNFSSVSSNIINSFINQAKSNKNLFNDRFKHMLNIELSNFYNSRGLFSPQDQVLKMITNNTSDIEQIINSYLNELHSIKIKHNSTVLETDIYSLCLSLRNLATELYTNMARFYPQQVKEICNSFTELATKSAEIPETAETASYKYKLPSNF